MIRHVTVRGRAYVIIVRPAGNGYSAEWPGLPDAKAEGSTVEEALKQMTYTLLDSMSVRDDQK